MTNRGRRRAIVVLLIAGASLVRAEQSRDQARPGSATGTARIDGIVMESDNRQPIRRVIVTLTGSELPSGRTAISDDDGRFVFEGVPAGRFDVVGDEAGVHSGRVRRRPSRASGHSTAGQSR